MSLEQKIEALTAALEANTAALLKGGSASAEKPEGKTKTEGKAKAYEPKFTKEAMQTLMNQVREKIGMDKAKEIRDNIGKVAKISELADPKVIDAVAAAAEQALADKAAEEEEGM